MKNVLLATTALFLATTSAMANQGCSINDGKGDVINEMTVDSSVPLSPVASDWLILKNSYHGYEIKAVFTGKDQEDAIITAIKGDTEISAAGFQLALKESGNLIFTVTCGN